jgi:peroxiredoxin
LKKPAPVQSQTSLLEVGRPAPLIAAKDRIGLIYRTADYRGRKLLLVFVPTLDGNAKRIIRELNALRSSEAVSGAMVVIVQPDRTAIRQFVLSEHIQVPILFGTPAVARAYRISGQQAVLYVVSEQGYVVRRQAGRIDPRAVAN